MSDSWSLFWQSTILFIVLNSIENWLHFSIGRGEKNDRVIHLAMPSSGDLMRMSGVMLIFAALQGALTAIWAVKTV